MEQIQEHLRLILKISINSQNHFVKKYQDELIRFVYCGIEKVQKVSSTFLMFYSQMDNNDELEFSLGILARTLLMDMILVLKIKSITLDHTGNLEELRIKLKQFCYGIVTDGAKYELDQIYFNNSLTEDKKKEYYEIIDKVFPNAFDFSGDKPKTKIKNGVNLSKFCKECQHTSLTDRERICSLYFYYSKYDHLSHLSSLLPSEVSFEKRKEMIDLSIILTITHLKDLLAIAHDFDKEYKILFPYITELKNHFANHYS